MGFGAALAAMRVLWRTKSRGSIAQGVRRVACPVVQGAGTCRLLPWPPLPSVGPQGFDAPSAKTGVMHGLKMPE